MRKTVLITGASSGIGLAAARRFAEAGYDVALLARTLDGLEVAAAEARAAGARAIVTPADVTDRDAVRAAVDQAVAALGRLDAVVLSHAVAVYGRFEDVPPEEFDRVVEVNFLGGVRVTREVLPHLEATGGTLVGVGSLNARVPLPTWSSYAASKHALRGFLNTLRVELQADGSLVQVAQLHPGPVDTPIWDNVETLGDHQPRKPPDGYPPEQVAEELVGLVEHPVPERVFGGEAILLDKLWAGVRPVGEAAMGLLYHYFRSGKEPPHPGTHGQAAGGLLQRPSLSALLRRLPRP